MRSVIFSVATVLKRVLDMAQTYLERRRARKNQEKYQEKRDNAAKDPGGSFAVHFSDGWLRDQDGNRIRKKGTDKTDSGD